MKKLTRRHWTAGFSRNLRSRLVDKLLLLDADRLVFAADGSTLCSICLRDPAESERSMGRAQPK
ncbi:MULTISPECIES: hypothetical protein [unclassified Sinorhizobium]|uniref:hypothetical protein n=1 Tax=unclassified Sinorhizobium TaxID=2613772 RepID=UPI0024C39328|nr:MULTISPECIES: hypothetical protein [unclassified Sinorhizobium]MDK1376914.1 hypothetical protein [Sinorhizobium sp. 6-70]MDK1482532.1 hypothetical protein [Sinorhizobium sp. 6-117]